MGLIVLTRRIRITREALFLYVMQLIMFPEFKTEQERGLKKLVERCGNEDDFSLLSRAKNFIEYLARNDLKKWSREDWRFIALNLYGQGKYIFPE